MKFYVAIVQDEEADVLGGYIVLNAESEHLQPIWDRHVRDADNGVSARPVNIVVMDGPTVIRSGIHSVMRGGLLLDDLRS
jgi:hypothetical protein